MPSIRRRILLPQLVGLALLLAAAAYYGDRSFRGRLLAEYDTALLAEARAVTTIVEEEDGHVQVDSDGVRMPEFEREQDPDYCEFWLDDGTVLYRSPSLRDHDLPRGPLTAGSVRFCNQALPDGRRGRMVRVRFSPVLAVQDEDTAPAEAPPPAQPSARTVLLVVARGRAHLDEVIATVRASLGIAAAVLLRLCAMLVWGVLAGGLAPLRRLATEVSALDESSLHARIAIPSLHQELAPVVRQINDLLRRLEEAFQRERRFNANVAHELRTPLAELRALAEVGGRWPDAPEVRDGFFSDVCAISLRMERMVGDLLLLAHCQAGQETLRRAPVVVAEVIATCWSRLEAKAAARRIEFKLQIPADARIETDADKLEILLANLLSNAVSYAPEGSDVRCQGAIEGGRFRLDVANPAGNLDPADMARLQEPFWRKSESRTGGEHLGIGLTLAAALADLLDLDLHLNLNPAGWFRAVVSGSAR